MKSFEEYRFTIRHSDIKQDIYKYKPKDREELIDILYKEINLQGYKADLNCVDTSKITNMNNIFYGSQFNGDISEWDVSNVTNMCEMFSNSHFNGDISGWNVGNVTDMKEMFYNSRFNGDISGWDVSSVEDMNSMFQRSKFNRDISKWNVSNVIRAFYIFDECPIKEEYKPKFKC